MTYSFIINSTKHLNNGGLYQRIILDEALVFHTAEVLFTFTAILAGVSDLLVGDLNKIQNINRSTYFKTKRHSLINYAETTQTLVISYRCTKIAP